jgi:hypothetical protein
MSFIICGKNKEDEIDRACSMYGDMRSACKVFVRKPKRKRPLGSYRYRWEDDIKMNLK